MVELNDLVKTGVSEKRVSSVVNKILKELKRKGDVSVVFAGDMEIKRLNKKYRKRDELTDVLSFSNLEGGKLIMPEGSNYLGEVIIGYEQMKRQAKERGYQEHRELLILLIHGVLHLLGYEHKRGGREAEIMREKEAELLGMFKIDK